MQQQTQQNDSQILTETSQLIETSDLDKKEQRVRKAVILYYGDNEYQTEAEVAEELGVERETVSRYLNSDTADGFKKVFSHKEKEEIDRWLQDLVARHFNEAVKGLKKAKRRAENDPEASPQHLTNASMALLKADKKLGETLQELGVIDKQEASDSNDSGEPVQFEMRYTSPDEEETSDEQD